MLSNITERSLIRIIVTLAIENEIDEVKPTQLSCKNHKYQRNITIVIMIATIIYQKEVLNLREDLLLN